MRRGSCLCGKVTLEVEGELKNPDACHCRECRKTSGHYFVSTDIKRQNVSIKGEDNITWFHSSKKVRRGFCKTCGTNLFFDPLDTNKHDWTAVAMGAFDDPTGTQVGMHIFVSEKGDYYQLTDGLPQNQN